MKIELEINKKLILFTFAIGGLIQALSAFIIFSLTMALLMTALSFLVGLAKKETLERLTDVAPKIKKWSAIILVLVGAYLLLSSIFVGQFVFLLFPR